MRSATHPSLESVKEKNPDESLFFFSFVFRRCWHPNRVNYLISYWLSGFEVFATSVYLFWTLAGIIIFGLFKKIYLPHTMGMGIDSKLTNYIHFWTTVARLRCRHHFFFHWLSALDYLKNFNIQMLQQRCQFSNRFARLVIWIWRYWKYFPNMRRQYIFNVKIKNSRQGFKSC